MNQVFYAFAERVERARGEVRATFDSLQEIDLIHLFHRQVHKNVENPLMSVSSALIELSLPVKQLYNFLEGRLLTKGRWYRLHVSEEGQTSANIFPDPSMPKHMSISVDYLEWLDRRTPEVTFLEQIFSLDSFPNATIEEIKKVLNVIDVSSIVCYDVGQGMCCAGCSHLGKPVIYYDFGGGIGSNSHTYSSSLRFCLSRQPVVLSHWDMDHWISALKFPEITRGVWVVPRQGPFGVKAAQLAYNIKQNGKLLVWPLSVSALQTSIGDILKLSKHSNRNYSGLVVIAQMPINDHDDTVLIPGDAPYNKIPLAGRVLTGLVATHHGGWHRGDHPPMPTNHARIAFSFGMNNTYGHPVPTALRRYANTGWQNRFDTPQGHICMTCGNGPVAPLPCSVTRIISPAHPCSGTCTLAPKQP